MRCGPDLHALPVLPKYSADRAEGMPGNITKRRLTAFRPQLGRARATALGYVGGQQRAAAEVDLVARFRQPLAVVGDGGSRIAINAAAGPHRAIVKTINSIVLRLELIDRGLVVGDRYLRLNGRRGQQLQPLPRKDPQRAPNGCLDRARGRHGALFL